MPKVSAEERLINIQAECVVLVKLSEDNKLIEDVRIAYGVAGPNPMRCYQAEQFIIEMKANEETARILGTEALKEVTPRTSWRASKEFRLQLVEELGMRAFLEEVRRAEGEYSIQSGFFLQILL